MSLVVEETLARYAEERPAFEASCRRVASLLEEHLQAVGLVPRVTWRTKDSDSLVKKMVRKDQAYDGVLDKAGVRVVLGYPDDADKVCEVIRHQFEVLDEDNKSEKLSADVFRYAGVHFLIADPDGRRAGGRALCCEVQVHKPGEALWASLSHDLTYKAPPGIPKATERAINRLAALTELIDLEATRVRRSLMQSEGASEANLLMTLEKHFFRMTACRYDERLSLILLRELSEALDEPVDQAACDAVDAFCRANHERLRFLFDRKQDAVRYPFLLQPETLFAFYLLAKDEFRLEQKWPQRLPASELQKLRNLWGAYA